MGYGVKIFLPSPPNCVTRSPGRYSDNDCHLILPRLMLLANSSQLKFKVLSLGETWEISFVGSRSSSWFSSVFFPRQKLCDATAVVSSSTDSLDVISPGLCFPRFSTVFLHGPSASTAKT